MYSLRRAGRIRARSVVGCWAMLIGPMGWVTTQKQSFTHTNKVFWAFESYKVKEISSGCIKIFRSPYSL